MTTREENLKKINEELELLSEEELEQVAGGNTLPTLQPNQQGYYSQPIPPQGNRPPYPPNYPPNPNSGSWNQPPQGYQPSGYNWNVPPTQKQMRRTVEIVKKPFGTMSEGFCVVIGKIFC